MLGFLEPNHQAMVTIELDQRPLDFLIDTGFDGTLIIGEELIDTSSLIPLGTIVAELASHQTGNDSNIFIFHNSHKHIHHIRVGRSSADQGVELIPEGPGIMTFERFRGGW